jgi:hypothetical protein
MHKLLISSIQKGNHAFIMVTGNVDVCNIRTNFNEILECRKKLFFCSLFNDAFSASQTI